MPEGGAFQNVSRNLKINKGNVIIFLCLAEYKLTVFRHLFLSQFSKVRFNVAGVKLSVRLSLIKPSEGERERERDRERERERERVGGKFRRNHQTVNDNFAFLLFTLSFSPHLPFSSSSFHTSSSSLAYFISFPSCRWQLVSYCTTTATTTPEKRSV